MEITEKVVGIINNFTSRTKFKDDNTSYILKANDKDKKTITVLITTSQNLVEGSEYEFHGIWGEHPTYGKQFKAMSANRQEFSDVGLRAFFTKNKEMKGLGGKTVQKIFDLYNNKVEDILRVIENNPMELTKIKGITTEKAQNIFDVYTKDVLMNETLAFLYEFVNVGQAMKVWEKFGLKTKSIIQENPYKLTMVKGISFKTVDGIAMRRNPDFEKDEKRIRAGVFYVLADHIESDGHCFIEQSGHNGMTHELLYELGYKDKIFDKLSEENKITVAGDKHQKYKNFEMQYPEFFITFEDELKEYRDLINKVVEDLITEEKIIKTSRVVVNAKGEEYINDKCLYNKKVFETEMRIYRKLIEINNTIELNEKRLDEAFKKAIEEANITLSDEQEAGIKLLLKSRVGILTGAAGTGKTTVTNILIRTLKHYYKGEKMKIKISAPTGMAAKRAANVTGEDAITNHKLLGAKGDFYFEHNEQNPLDLDILAMDETSMVDMDMFDRILSALQHKTQLFLIGDYNQLPSIGKGNILRDLIESGSLPTVKLTQVFRQKKENLILKYAHKILNYQNEYQIYAKEKASNILKGQLKVDVLDMKDRQTVSLYKGILNDNDKRFKYDFFYETMDFPDPFKNPTDFAEKDCLFIDMDDIKKRKMDNANFFVDGISKRLEQYHPEYKTVQYLIPMRATDLGVENINLVSQKHFNPASGEKLEYVYNDTKKKKLFRVGDKVIFLKNDYEIGLVNGDVGTLKDIYVEDGKDKMTVDFYGLDQEIPKSHFKNMDLRYAITVHKSQGSEYDVVVIGLTTAAFTLLNPELVYTALTRGKKKVVFYGQKEALKMALEKNEVKRRRTGLKFLLKN